MDNRQAYILGVMSVIAFIMVLYSGMVIGYRVHDNVPQETKIVVVNNTEIRERLVDTSITFHKTETGDIVVLPVGANT